MEDEEEIELEDLNESSKEQETTEEQKITEEQKKYNEISKKSYGDLKNSDDFLTWLLIKLGIIEPEDLDKEGIVKEDSLKKMDDEKKTEFKQKYKEYTEEDAPEDINNLSDEDKKKINEEVKNCEKAEDPYLENIVNKIIDCKMISTLSEEEIKEKYGIKEEDITETGDKKRDIIKKVNDARKSNLDELERLENKLKTALIPKNIIKYESYVNAIQIRINNPKLTMEAALNQAKNYEIEKPEKPSYYFLNYLFKEGRMYRKNEEKFQYNEIANKEKEDALKLMDLGYHGTPGEVMGKINKRIKLLSGKEANASQKAILTDIGINACKIYEERCKKYEKENSGIKPDLAKQTLLFEESFAIAAKGSIDSGKAEKADTGLKALTNSIKMSNADCRVGYKTYTTAVSASAKTNTRDTIKNDYNKQINQISEDFANGKINAEEANRKREKLNNMLDEYKENSKNYKNNVNRFNYLEGALLKRSKTLNKINPLNKTVKEEAKAAERVAKSLFRWSNRKNLEKEAEIAINNDENKSKDKAISL